MKHGGERCFHFVLGRICIPALKAVQRTWFFLSTLPYACGIRKEMKKKKNVLTNKLTTLWGKNGILKS
jgi:hypothetical protein